MKKKKVRISEVVAVIVCIAIVAVFSFVPQIFTDRALSAMKIKADYALAHCRDYKECRAAIDELMSIYRKNSHLLLLVYNHADVSDLELAAERADSVLDTAPTDYMRLSLEIVCIRSYIATLLEKECLSPEHLL